MNMFFMKAAKAAGILPVLLKAVCWTESAHRPLALNVDDGGSPSYGVCQIKEDTAELVEPGILPHELMEPETNTRIASVLLKRASQKHNGNVTWTVAEYNAGTARFCPTTLGVCNATYVSKVLTAMKEKPWLAQK